MKGIGIQQCGLNKATKVQFSKIESLLHNPCEAAVVHVRVTLRITEESSKPALIHKGNLGFVASYTKQLELGFS